MHLKHLKMASTRLGLQDRKDLDKFTSFLAFKMVQIIVQSRLGEKTKTKSKPHSSGSDWFNLSIRDLPEVYTETKKALAGQIPTVGLGMCIEISLKTVEGDTMVLETWYLEMTDQYDSSVRVTYTVYNRMSLLLKSLIAVTRVTPAYKLSSLQGAASFVICYRVYMGEPQWFSLGDCYHSVKVGQVGTPIGTLVLSVAYRTQLTITPQKAASRDCPFLVKSDHFKPDASPKWPHRPSHIAFHVDHRSVVDELAAASEDCQDTRQINNQYQATGHTFLNGDWKVVGKANRENDTSPTGAWEKQVSFSDGKKVGAFATDPKKLDGTDNADCCMIPDVPFSSLLQHQNSTDRQNCYNNNNGCNVDNIVNNNCNNTVPPLDDLDSRSVASDAESHKSHSSDTEDFVLVELKPPFAGAEGTAADLGTFFRECQTAPPSLLSFSDQPTFADQVNELTNQLANFETHLPEFDDFVESLCQDETVK